LIPRAAAVRLPPGNIREIVDTLTDAFLEYPVMRFVCGTIPSYNARVQRLVELFVSNRVLRGESIFGVRDASGLLVGAATTTRPESPVASPQLVALREEIWAELGPDARERYDRFAAATEATAVPGRHHHLNMIGIRRAHHGRGYARPLLEAVRDFANADAASGGVSLTTELPRNRALYEHFGYTVVGEDGVAGEFRTWTLFRPRDTR